MCPSFLQLHLWKSLSNHGVYANFNHEHSGVQTRWFHSDIYVSIDFSHTMFASVRPFALRCVAEQILLKTSESFDKTLRVTEGSFDERLREWRKVSFDKLLSAIDRILWYDFKGN